MNFRIPILLQIYLLGGFILLGLGIFIVISFNELSTKENLKKYNHISNLIEKKFEVELSQCNKTDCNLNSSLDGVILPEDEFIIICNNQGKVLSSFQSNHKIGDVLQLKKLKERAYINNIYYAPVKGTKLLIVLGHNKIFSSYLNIEYVTGRIFIVMAILFVFSTYFYGNWLTKRLRRIHFSMKTLIESSNNDPLFSDSIDEVSEIENLLFRLSQKLEQINEETKGKLRDLSEELFICKEELEVSLSNNKDATESRTIFLSHLSHEIRTHINAIMGYLQLLKKEKVFDNFTYKTRDYLQGISISSDNLVELITNVLNLSRIESGKLEIKEENVNIKLLLQGIYHLNKSKAIKKSINFNYSFDPDVPEYIYADRGKLNRILTNLSNNAIKLSSHGRKINLKISHLEDKLIFSIHCEGVNLAAEIKQSLFDYNIKDYEFREFDYIKTSLGFYTAKQMAKLMGGVFEIQTESGDGCKLLLSIHYIASEPKLETVSTEISYKSELIYNILIIDDDLFNLEILESLFSNLGMNVEKSDNPHNIFKKLSNFKADLILVDMNMPLMNGVDLAKQIKESDDFKSIPIIGMSADIYLYQDKNIEEQFVDFIYKPVDFSQLQDKVNQILGNKKTENASDSQIMYPPDLQMKIKAHLTKIKAIPLFFPEKIFSEMKLIEELCETNKLAPPKLLSQIKEAIYNRRSSDIPSLLETEGHV